MALRLQAPANAGPEGKDRMCRPVRVGPDSGGTPPIGVFDSGLGGLTAARELAAMLPGEDILYFGDTGRVPYGSRGPEVIRRYARQDAAFLLGQGVKALVCACGTVSSVAGEELARRAGCPFIEVVGPAALAAQKATRTGRVGVIATAATIHSGKFPAALRALDPGIRVLDRACPLFVPLVEGGHIAADDPIAVPAVEYYLREFREWGADTLILGCTHYPLLAPLIQRYLGEGVTLVSSGREAARATGERLGQLGLLSGREAGGRSRYFVTDDAGSFSAVAEVFLEAPVTDVTPVEIARLEQLEL